MTTFWPPFVDQSSHLAICLCLLPVPQSKTVSGKQNKHKGFISTGFISD